MIKITKAGWIYVLLTIVVGFAAVNTANNLIYILASALLSYMLVSGIFGRKNIYALTVRIIFPEEMFARTPTPVTIRVVNPRKHLPALLIHVLVGESKIFFPYIPAAGSTKGTLRMTPDRRGVFRPDKVRIASTFPFNFFTRYRTIREDFETVVFPQPKRCAMASINRGLHRRHGDSANDRLGDTPDILAIRNYLPGDPLKRIHWKSSAKTGALKTKEFAAADESEVIIDFDQVPVKDLEEKISCVTFWVMQLSRSHRAFGMNIDGRLYHARQSAAHKRVLLRILAVHGQS